MRFYPAFWLAVVLLFLLWMDAYLAQVVAHETWSDGATLTLHCESGASGCTRVSSGRRLDKHQQYSADMYWYSGSEKSPVIRLCGSDLHIEQTAQLAQLSSYIEPDTGAACYQLLPLSPEGRVKLHGIPPDLEAGSHIDASEVAAGWLVHFHFIENSEERDGHGIQAKEHDKALSSASNHTGNGFPYAQRRTQLRFRGNVLTAGDEGDPGDFPDTPRRPGYFDYSNTVLLVTPLAITTLSPLVDWLDNLVHNLWRIAFELSVNKDSDAPGAEEPTGYVIQLHTEHGTLVSILTRDDWLSLIQQNGVSAEGILSWFRQNESDIQHVQWLDALQCPLDHREAGGIPFIKPFIEPFIEQLPPPVSVETSVCGSFNIPGIIELGKKKKRESAAVSSSDGEKDGEKGGEKSGTTGALTSAVSTKGSSGGGGASGGGLPPAESEEESFESSAEELNLIRVLESFKGFRMLGHQYLLMALYGVGLLSFDDAVVLEAASKSEQQAKVKELAATIKDTDEKILFLQLIYFHLDSDGFYKTSLPSFMDSIPQVYRKSVQRCFQLNIDFPQDEESALEVLRKVTSVTFLSFSYINALHQAFAAEASFSRNSAYLNRCHSQGIAGYRTLYRDVHFHKFFETYLSPTFLNWLKGGASPWPDPELAIIDSAEMAIAMPGLSRLDSWATFLLEAYGNSALTFHQFKKLVEKSDVERYEAIGRVAATLDERRAARFLLTLVELLRKQHPLLAEKLIKQSGEGVRLCLFSSMRALPLPAETGEGDHWRRAFAASLLHHQNKDSVLSLESCLFSNFVLKKMLSFTCCQNRPLIELKCCMVVSLLSEFSVSYWGGGGVLKAMEQSKNKVGLRAYLNILELLTKSRPSLLGRHPRGEEAESGEAATKQHKSLVECPVCFLDMSTRPTVLCLNCLNAVCLSCGEKLCVNSRAECPMCRKLDLTIPRQFRN